MLESVYQAKLIKELKHLFPGCIILKNDTERRQGIPDLVIFYKDRWAMLEVKADENSEEQPNQRWYVELLDLMSFAAFIFPQNQEEVLNALQSSFRNRRTTRVSKS